MEKELFALLRLGLGTSTTKEENLSDFIVLSAEKWAQLGDMARKQGVLGIMLDGVEGLEGTKYGLTRGLTPNQKLEWIGEVLQIEQRNRRQVEVMNDLAGKWKINGCRVMIMKGQANGTMYPKPEHRSPGDIDCYLFNCNINPNDNLNDDKEAYRIGNDIARAAGAKVDESWYKHSVISYKGETFENHQFFVHTRDGKRGKRLEKELEDVLAESTENLERKGHTEPTTNREQSSLLELPRCEGGRRSQSTESTENLTSYFLPLTSNTVMPPVQWTAMFLTYHACAHFVSEGLRLKQILDWTMFLKALQGDVNWEAFWGFCERNHLKVFAEAMNTIARRWFRVCLADNADIYCHTESTENTESFESPYAERIMKSALYDEDYVFNSGKSGWANRLHLVRNMFRYRWKYEEVYQTSVWKQLWWYACGFLFKTE